MNEKYKAIIYDWDGCLLDSLPVWVGAHRQILAENGMKATLKTIVNAIGNRNAFNTYGLIDNELYNNKLNDYLLTHMVDTKLFSGVLDTLSKLNENNVKIFIATSTHRNVFDVTLAFRLIEKYFTHIIFADDVSFLKPNPEPINMILNKYNISENEVVMVGDSAKDIHAAENANIDMIWFAPEENEQIHDFKYLSSLKLKNTIRNHEEIVKYF